MCFVSLSRLDCLCSRRSLSSCLISFCSRWDLCCSCNATGPIHTLSHFDRVPSVNKSRLETVIFVCSLNLSYTAKAPYQTCQTFLLVLASAVGYTAVGPSFSTSLKQHLKNENFWENSFVMNGNIDRVA